MSGFYLTFLLRKEFEYIIYSLLFYNVSFIVYKPNEYTYITLSFNWFINFTCYTGSFPSFIYAWNSPVGFSLQYLFSLLHWIGKLVQILWLMSALNFGCTRVPDRGTFGWRLFQNSWCCSRLASSQSCFPGVTCKFTAEWKYKHGKRSKTRRSRERHYRWPCDSTERLSRELCL